MEPDITAEEIHNLIRARAHELWEAEGRQHGSDGRHWLEAQKQVLEEDDRSGATGPVSDAIAIEPRTGGDTDKRQEELLDEAIEETFPASDPISPKRIT